MQSASKISCAVKCIAICVESNARNASGECLTIALYGGEAVNESTSAPASSPWNSSDFASQAC